MEPVIGGVVLVFMTRVQRARVCFLESPKVEAAQMCAHLPPPLPPLPKQRNVKHLSAVSGENATM